MSSETLTISAPPGLGRVGRPLRGFAVWRYYDPATGQFLSVDPLLERTGAAYIYASGDPVDTADPSGEAIPLDFGAPTGAFTGDNGGGSHGAHFGRNVWGGGQLNGYSCLQTAVDENAPGLARVYGDLTDPGGWAYWGPLLGTLGMAPMVAFPIEDALPLAIDAAGVEASVVRSQIGTVASLLRAAISSNVGRAVAADELRARVRTGNYYMSQAAARPISGATGYIRSAAIAWIRGFLRGY